MQQVIEDVIASTTATITSTLGAILPGVFVVFASLLALGLAIYYVRKLIQRRK